MSKRIVMLLCAVLCVVVGAGAGITAVKLFRPVPAHRTAKIQRTQEVLLDEILLRAKARVGPNKQMGAGSELHRLALAYNEMQKAELCNSLLKVTRSVDPQLNRLESEGQYFIKKLMENPEILKDIGREIARDPDGEGAIVRQLIEALMRSVRVDTKSLDPHIEEGKKWYLDDDLDVEEEVEDGYPEMPDAW